MEEEVVENYKWRWMKGSDRTVSYFIPTIYIYLNFFSFSNSCLVSSVCDEYLSIIIVINCSTFLIINISQQLSTYSNSMNRKYLLIFLIETLWECAVGCHSINFCCEYSEIDLDVLCIANAHMHTMYFAYCGWVW